jgi:hypothetical protein
MNPDVRTTPFPTLIDRDVAKGDVRSGQPGKRSVRDRH